LSGNPTILVDLVEILQIRHGYDAVLAERARVVEHARRARLVVAVVEIVADDHHALLDAPHRRADGEIRRFLHPFFAAAVVGVVMVGSQQQAIALANAVVEPLLQVLLGDGLARQFVAQVGYDRVADEQVEGQLVDLGAAAHIVLRRVDVTASVQPHVHAAHDLAGASRRIMLLDDLHLELHVLFESRGRAHREILRIELETDVDDPLKLNGHPTPPWTGSTSHVGKCRKRTFARCHGRWQKLSEIRLRLIVMP